MYDVIPGFRLNFEILTNSMAHSIASEVDCCSFGQQILHYCVYKMSPLDCTLSQNLVHTLSSISVTN
jgi:hypothetical protein